MVKLLKSVQNPSKTDFKKPNLIYVDMVRCADARGNSLNLNGKEGAGNGLTNILILNKDFIFYCIVIRFLTFSLLPPN